MVTEETNERVIDHCAAIMDALIEAGATPTEVRGLLFSLGQMWANMCGVDNVQFWRRFAQTLEIVIERLEGDNGRKKN